MRSLILSVVVLAVGAACSSGTNPIGVGVGDAGSGEASTKPAPKCTLHSESERAQLCVATSSKQALYVCDEGASPPSPDCTSTAEAGSYCCPVKDAVSDAGPDAAPTGSATNPYGVPYPTDNIGWNSRTPTKRGDRIANVTLQGYRPTSTTLVSVSLADLYDPDLKTHDAVVVVGASRWDTFSKQMLDTTKTSKKRIATFAVIGEGTTPSQAATLVDLATFRGSNPWATTALDAGFMAFGPAFDASAVPLVMVIDARTMEISYAGVGALPNVAALDAEVTAITSRPAAY